MSHSKASNGATYHSPLHNTMQACVNSNHWAGAGFREAAECPNTNQALWPAWTDLLAGFWLVLSTWASWAASERASVARQEIARDSAVGAQSLAIPEWNIIALGLAFLCGCMPPNTVRRPEFRRNFGEKNVEGNKRRGKALLVHTTNATRQKGAGGLHWYIQLAAHQIECGHTCYCRGAKEVFQSPCEGTSI